MGSHRASTLSETAARCIGPDHANAVLHLRVSTAAHHVRKAHQEISLQLRRRALPQSHLHRIELVLAEIMNNIVDHAYHNQEPSDFSLEISELQDDFWFRFEDCGLPMPGVATPEGAHPDLNVELGELPENGFGWIMIRQLADRLEYKRENDRNILAFRVCSTPRVPQG